MNDAPLKWWRDKPDTTEIMSFLLIVLAVIAVVVGIQWLAELIRRRRERRIFFQRVDERSLSPLEEEEIRNLVNSSSLHRPSEIFSSLALFDSAAEKAIQSILNSRPREEVEAKMDLLYGLRAKVFPEAVDWQARMAIRKKSGRKDAGQEETERTTEDG